MARIFITGSADGLGKMAAELLIEQGHRLVLHARSQARADETKRNLPEVGAASITYGRRASFDLPTTLASKIGSSQSASASADRSARVASLIRISW